MIRSDHAWVWLYLTLFAIVAFLPSGQRPMAQARSSLTGSVTSDDQGYVVYVPMVGTERLHALGVTGSLDLALPLCLNLEPTATLRPTLTATPTMGPTSTPRPTPTPTPTWPPGLEKPGRSKLGLHVARNNSPDIMEFVRRTKPKVVKAVGDVGWLNDVKEASPNTMTIGRLEADQQTVFGDPEAAARDFVARYLADYLANSGVDYWEGWNEPDPHYMEWYARFEAERVRVMAANGLRAAVGGFSTGTPEWDEFEQFLPAIQAVSRYGGILTLHEYGAPTLDSGVGMALPGRQAHPDRGVLTLRYRWWYEALLLPRGLAVPLVISEAGIDGTIASRVGPEGKGWQDFADYWSQQKLGQDKVGAYIRQLAWYDHELQRDDYVVGCAIFTAGAPSGSWDSFDITSILRHLATYVISQG